MVQPSGITFPTYRVAAMDTDYYTQVLIVCGAWTAFRDAGSYSRPAWSAVKLTLLAGWPIVIAGLLITDVRTGPPSVLEVATAPILSLPMYWVYGYLGGYIGRGLRSFTRWIAKRPAATT
jgi:hypothetical protein